MGTASGRLPSRLKSLVALPLLLPAVIVVPEPHRAAFVLLLIGLVLHLFSAIRPQDAPTQALGRLGLGAVLSGVILLAQGLALELYIVQTSRSHEVPEMLARAIGAAAGWLGMHVGVYGSQVSVFAMREHQFQGATWELLLDPVTMCFLVGGVVALGWRSWSDRATRPLWSRWLSAAAVFLGLTSLWLPIRSSFLMAFYLNSVLRVEYEEMPNSVYWFWSGWLHLAMLAVPALAAWRFASLRPLADAKPAASARPSGSSAPGRLLAGMGLAFLAALAGTLAIFWDPVGPRKQGRVVIEEYNPDPEKVWERCDKPFDTTWYGHLSGYNYWCIRDYLSYFYDVRRLDQPLSDTNLRACDVLILKVPTRPAYSRDELEAIRRFVAEGGGLMVVGEHTDVFGTSTHLNPVGEMFGFRYVADCLFGVDSVFEQHYEPPRVPHPVVQYIDELEFATSCSLNVGNGSGRAVIRSIGLKNKTAEYHVENFYPPPNDTVKMRCGAFLQLWSTRYGKGRVLAFTDSTQFSNFCTFEEGKSELFVGMTEWLNHRQPGWDPRPWLTTLTVLLGGAAVFLAAGSDGAWLLLLAAAVAGHCAGGSAVVAMNHYAMPFPQPKSESRVPSRVIFDRTVSDVILSHNGFIGGKPEGFGIFERWILRLGYFIGRRSAPKSFNEDVNLLIIPYPTKMVTDDYRNKLAEFVEQGGRVLVLDSGLNRSSTANDLLKPFGVTLDRERCYNGNLQNSEHWANVAVEKALEVKAGDDAKVFGWLGDNKQVPLCVWQPFGKGSLTVIGCGDRFCDQKMGVTGDIVPDLQLKGLYAIEYSIMRTLVNARPLGEGTALREPEPAVNP
jgi:hypothetical protein